MDLATTERKNLVWIYVSFTEKILIQRKPADGAWKPKRSIKKVI